MKNINYFAGSREQRHRIQPRYEWQDQKLWRVKDEFLIKLKLVETTRHFDARWLH